MAMTMTRVLEIAKGSEPTSTESRELADEILRLRDALQGCHLAAERITSEVKKAKPKDTLGSW